MGRDPAANTAGRESAGRLAAERAAARSAEQEPLDPTNPDDAWWIVCHPAGFSAEVLATARRTDAEAGT